MYPAGWGILHKTGLKFPTSTIHDHRTSTRYDSTSYSIKESQQCSDPATASGH